MTSGDAGGIADGAVKVVVELPAALDAGACGTADGRRSREEKMAAVAAAPEMADTPAMIASVDLDMTERHL